MSIEDYCKAASRATRGKHSGNGIPVAPHFFLNGFKGFACTRTTLLKKQTACALKEEGAESDDQEATGN
jgi:hypothetical protein